MRKFILLLLLMPSTYIKCDYSDIVQLIISIFITPEREQNSEKCQRECNQAKILLENELLKEDSHNNPTLLILAATLSPDDDNRVAHCTEAVKLLKKIPGSFFRP